MTDKIRIVGEFGDNAVETVQSFLGTLTGVQSASLLRNGVEQLPQTEGAQQATAETAETA